MATIDGIGLAEPSTITKSLAAVPVTRNSSVTYQEVMVLGSPNSTTLLSLAEVMGSAPASTTVGLVTRPVGPLSVINSTATDLQAAVQPIAGSTWRTQPGSTLWATSAGFHFDSSGALQITGASASTGVTVNRTVGNSSAADYMPVRLVDSSGTGFLAPGNEYADGSTYSTKTGPALMFDNSSNQTMRMVALTAPLPVQITDSSNAAVKAGDSANNAIRVNVVAGAAAGSTVVTVSALPLVSTAAAAANSSALLVREVYPSLLSTRVVITSSNSTALYTLVSSAANVGHKVYAYTLTSTETTPSTLVFFSSNSGDKWAVSFGSGSSGISGANLAIQPPAWLFQSAANEALRCLIEKAASTQCVVTLSIAYFSAA